MPLQLTNQKSFINLFPQEVDENNKNFLDVWNSFRVKVIPEIYNADAYFQYTPTKADSLYGLANKFYNDVNLWWVIPLVNDVEDPFDFLDTVRDEGTTINILRTNYVHSILYTIGRLKNSKDNEIRNGNNN